MIKKEKVANTDNLCTEVDAAKHPDWIKNKKRNNNKSKWLRTGTVCMQRHTPLGKRSALAAFRNYHSEANF